LAIHRKRILPWVAHPWNSPFESAVIPGVESVTSELTDEDWLSSGSLSNRFLPTSL
jgi:hypothetical protein